MADREDCIESCLLISIEADNRDALFDGYRDYLVFMSLVRDAVRGCQYKVYGYCWLQKQCLMLIQPQDKLVGQFLLRLLRRYHFWLLQRGPSMTEFKLGIVELKNPSWILDCLRYLHQKAVIDQVVDDAMDFHWHSHHVYNGFWSINWLDTDFILSQFAEGRLVAMNRYRQYMLNTHRLDFNKMLETRDCSTTYINQADQSGWGTKQQVVAETNSHYHQSLMDRTRISFVSKNNHRHIKISVVNNNLSESDDLDVA